MEQLSIEYFSLINALQVLPIGTVGVHQTLPSSACAQQSLSIQSLFFCIQSEFNLPPIFCCRSCIFDWAHHVNWNYTPRSGVDTPRKDYTCVFTLASSHFPCDQNLHNPERYSIYLRYIVIISTVNGLMSKQQEQVILQNTHEGSKRMCTVSCAHSFTTSGTSHDGHAVKH